jgi:hypothetical protein
MAEALSRHGHPATQAHGIEKQETCDNSPQRGGATREQQVALAKHMAHNVTTADRYYDKSASFLFFDAVSLGSGMPMSAECFCHSDSTSLDMA